MQTSNSQCDGTAVEHNCQSVKLEQPAKHDSRAVQQMCESVKLKQTANSHYDGMAVHQMCESSRQIQTADSQCGGTAVQQFNSSQCDIEALQQIPSNRNHCDKGPPRPQNPSSHQDVSIGPIAVGEEFSSFDELNQRIIHFETKSFVQLYVRRSRSLEATRKRATKKDFPEQLKFGELDYHCIHGGKKFKSQSTGKRPNHM